MAWFRQENLHPQTGVYRMRRSPLLSAAPVTQRCAGSDCHLPPHAGALLCDRCVARLQADLRGLRDIYEESEHSLARPPTSLRQRVSGSRPIGIVLDDRTVAVRSEMTTTLASWARMIIDERGLTSRDQRDVRSLLCFLARHLDWLARHPAAADFADEVTRLVESAGELGGPGPVRLIALGHCLRAGCAGTLHAVIPAPGSTDRTTPHQVSCDTGHSLPPRQWLLLADRLNSADSSVNPVAHFLERAAG